MDEITLLKRSKGIYGHISLSADIIPTIGSILCPRQQQFVLTGGSRRVKKRMISKWKEDKDKHVRYFVRFVRQLFTFRTSFQGTRLQSVNRVRPPIIKTTLSGTHTCPYPTNIHQIDIKIRINILGPNASETFLMLDEFSSNTVWLMTRKIEVLENFLDDFSRICQ